MTLTPNDQDRETESGQPLGLSEELLAETYDVLRRIASRKLGSQRSSATLNTTMIVHEAWLKLSKDNDRRFADQNHRLNTGLGAGIFNHNKVSGLI